MNNEYNIGLVQWWDDEEMEFYQADLVFSLNDDINCLVNKLRRPQLKYFISFKKFDSEGTYIGGTYVNSNEILFNVAEEACGGYFCDLNDNRIICTETQINMINSFIKKI